MTRPTAATSPLLCVRDLSISFAVEGVLTTAVDNVSFDIAAGEKVGLVGESGSGKSVSGLALTRLGDRRGATLHPESRIELDGQEVTTASDRELRALRRSVASMVFQDPLGALNPMYTSGRQVAEAVKQRPRDERGDVKAESLQLLERVGLPDPERIYRSYPHQLSGGMRQRVVIAIALASRPKLIVADEPTTALDVTVQKRIIELFNELVDEDDISVLFISHDLSLVGSFVDRVMVMYAGRLVETGTVAEIFTQPAHPYTRALLQSAPSFDGAIQTTKGIPGAPPRIGAMPAGCRFHPRCEFVIDRCRVEAPALTTRPPVAHAAACHRAEHVAETPEPGAVPAVADHPSVPLREPASLVEVQGVTKLFGRARGRRDSRVTAVDDVSLKVATGDAYGIVGESGSGKSTLALMMAALEPPTTGMVHFDGADITGMSNRERRRLRRELQIVFQDPTSSLNPRLKVAKLLAEPLAIHGMLPGRTELRDRLVHALERVGLDAQDLDKYPGRFSGGQRQRIAIARGLILEPRLLILDEPVSSLDVSVQAEIVTLLQDLQDELELTYVFIAHDLALVRSFCNRVAVMQSGVLVEEGEIEQVLGDPKHPYTRELIRSMPVPVR